MRAGVNVHGRGSFDRAVCTEPLAFAADAVGPMGVGFGFAVQRAVLRDENVAGKAIESLLAVPIESLVQVAGAHLRSKVGVRAHGGEACLSTP